MTTTRLLQGPETYYSQSSLLSKMHYSYLHKFRKQISSLTSSVSLEQMQEFEKTMKDPQYDLYNEYCTHRKEGGSFFGFLLWKFKSRLALQIFFAFMTMTAQASLAIVFQLFIIELTADVRNQYNTMLSFLAIVVLLLVLTYSNTHHFRTGCTMSLGFRYNIIKLINQKIFTLSSYKIHQLTKSKLLNVVSSDISPIESMIFYFSYPILAPIFLVIHIAIYWTNFGSASLLGISGTFAFWPWMVIEAKITHGFISKRNRASDRRLSLVEEFIEKIRFIRMSGQSRLIMDKINQARAAEDKYSRHIGYFSWSTFGITKLAPILSFMPMVLVYYLQGGEMTLDKIFMTLLLLNYTKMTLVFFTKSGITFITEFRAACMRCQEVMDTESDKIGEILETPSSPRNAVEVQDYTAWWSESLYISRGDGGSSQASKPVLKDLNFTIKNNSLTIVLGKVGSGKSSLISAILQDVPRTEGQIRARGKIAVVEQEPLVFSGTVRDNITFGKSFDEKRYKKVVGACCLLPDFKMFSNSDLTLVGEKGYTLSGGQKARVAIARAVYADTDIVLLDDPLSALDVNVAKTLYENVIRKLLKDKAVLMVSNNWQLASYADDVILLSDGEIEKRGNYETLCQDLNFKIKTQGGPNNSLDRSNNDKIPEAELVLGDEITENPFKASLDLISMTYIRKYSSQSSKCSKFLILVLSAVIEVVFVVYGLYLGYSIQTKQLSLSEFEMIALAVAGTFMLCLLKGVAFTRFAVSSATSLHCSMLTNLVKTHTSFFDNTQSGDIINKFSTDMGALEKVIPFLVYVLLDGGLFFIFILLTLWIIQPVLIIHGLILGGTAWYILKIYIKIIVAARSLEIQTKTPLFDAFSQNISGLSLLRTFGKDRSMLRDFEQRLTNNKICTTAFMMYNQICGFQLEISFVIINSCIIALLVFFFELQPLFLVFSIMYLLQWGDYAQFTLRQTCEILVQMGCVQRIMKNLDTQQERPHELNADSDLSPQWPVNGSIRFQQVHARYRRDLPLVIKGISFEVKPGEKVACVGRTGAGKSTIAGLLFRTIELDNRTEHNSEIWVDGINIATIGLQKLRSSFSLIAQVPSLLTGTIRDNIDPSHKHSDLQIWKALEDVTLDKHIQSLPDKLDQEVNDSVTLFSSGQKQLVNLARVVLSQSKIVVLDEATSLIDYDTDQLIQKILFKKLRDCTVFNIAHRLTTIAAYDKIIVLERGEIAEIGHPYELLVKRVGDEGITNHEGVFGRLVKQSGEASASKILEIAKIHHEETFGKSA